MKDAMETKTAPSSTSDLLIDGGLLRVADAAKLLGLSRSSVYSLMDSGQLSYVKFGKSRRVPRRALTKLVTANLVGEAVE